MSDPNKDPLSEAEWCKAVKTTLDEGAAPLDDEVSGRLRQSRREAVRVAMGRQAKRRRQTQWLLPASGVAIVALVVVLSFGIGIGPADRPVPMDQSAVAGTEDLPLLTSPESLDLFEELDFYQWLEEERESVG